MNIYISLYSLSVMSLAGLRKPPNFVWDRDLVEKLKLIIISWHGEDGVYADQDRESDSFHLYDINGNSLSDLFNEELNRIPGHDSPSEETAEAEADKIILNFVR